MLERAGIDYIILEAENEIRPLGAVMSLGPSIMLAMDQLGLIDDISRNALPVQGVTLLDENLQRIFKFDLLYQKERYGYYPLTILRPALYNILMSKVPAYKLLFGKKVIHVAQNDEGVLIRCADSSTFSGDIVVGADGNESLVRELIFSELKAQNKLHPNDQLPVKTRESCLVGITNPMDPDRFPVLKSNMCEMNIVVPKKNERNMIWFVPMPGLRFGWGVTTIMNVRSRPSGPAKGGDGGGGEGDGGGGGGKRRARGASTSSSGSTHGRVHAGRSSVDSIHSVSPPLSSSVSSNPSVLSIPSGSMSSVVGPSSGGAMAAAALSSYTIKSSKKEKGWYQPTDFDHLFDAEYREQACPFGGTLGSLMDVTPRSMISHVVADEKYFHTWHHGRVVLVGDSCHRMTVLSGYGPTLAILDVITLASLLAELPSNDQRDVENLFQIYYERRNPNVRAIINANKKQEVMMFDRGFSGKVARKVTAAFVPEWMMGRMSDVLYGARPQLTFLKPLPDPGYRKNKAIKIQTPLLEDKRFDPQYAPYGLTPTGSFSSAESIKSSKSADSGGGSGNGVGRIGRQIAMGIVQRFVGQGSASSAPANFSSSTSGKWEQERGRSRDPIQDAISNYGSYYGIDND
ncbi:hypothetical protein BGW41_003342, partial [Actinomortierella wolfii]